MVYEIIQDSLLFGIRPTGVFFDNKEKAEKECVKLNKESFCSIYKVEENENISTLGLIQNKDGSWEIDNSLL